MPNAQVILGLLLAVVVLTTLARQLGVAYPILLVLICSLILVSSDTRRSPRRFCPRVGRSHG
jgi:hypothetical protein